MESGRRAAGSATGNGHARRLKRARPVQPSQDKRRPAQRTRPRWSMPGLSRRALVLASGGERARTHIRTETEADKHGRSMTVIHRTNHMTVPVTQCGVSNDQDEGWAGTLRSSRQKAIYQRAEIPSLPERSHNEAPQSIETNAQPAILCAARISPTPRTSRWCECGHRVGCGKEPLSAECTHPREAPRVVFGDAAGASCATRLHPTGYGGPAGTTPLQGCLSDGGLPTMTTVTLLHSLDRRENCVARASMARRLFPEACSSRLDA